MSVLRRIFCFLLLLPLAVLLQGCDGEVPDFGPPELVGSAWEVFRIEGRDVPEPERIWIEFVSRNQASGHSGCGGFSVDLVLMGENGGEGAQFGRYLATPGACRAQDRNFSRLFQEALTRVTRFELSRRELAAIDAGERAILRMRPRIDPAERRRIEAEADPARRASGGSAGGTE